MNESAPPMTGETRVTFTGGPDLVVNESLETVRDKITSALEAGGAAWVRFPIDDGADYVLARADAIAYLRKVIPSQPFAFVVPT